MLCQRQLFSLLLSVLGLHDSHMTLLHSAAYLLGCLMAGNGNALFTLPSLAVTTTSQFSLLAPIDVQNVVNCQFWKV